MGELVASGLAVEVDSVRVLDGVDLRIGAGEFVAVMGPAGAGKSTLARALAGLVPLAAGRLDGAAVGQVRVALQRPESTLLTDRVLDEVMLAARARGAPLAAAEQEARAWLEQLALPAAEFGDRDPLALSGGEQRRVAIAATLAAGARVLVLDEPGAGLDRNARGRLHDTLRALHARGATIVVVTHDPDEAAELATRVVVLGRGRVVADAPADHLLSNPAAARHLGLRVASEVEVLHAVALARGVDPPRVATSTAATAALVDIVADGPLRRALEPQASAPAPASTSQEAPLPRLPPLVDARIRVVATALAVVAALASASLLAGALVLLACAALVVLARIERARVRLAVRPLVALAVLLVALQLLVGGAPGVDLYRGEPAGFPVAPALLRAMQAAAIVLATLTLSAKTTMLDLSTALRRLLAPLRLLRVPVASLAFVVATGIGLVPAMSDELERLRLAQRARGLRPDERSVVARLRADAALTPSLFVAAFRRAHLLADALAVRGIDPRRPLHPWRPSRVPGIDVVLLVVAAVLVVLSRLA